MNNNSGSYTGFLYLYFYKILGSDIYNFFHNKKYHSEDLSILYTFNEEKGNIIETENYFQFIQSDDKNEYIVFDWKSADYIIEDEVRMGGIDFTLVELTLEECKRYAIINNFKDLSIPVPTIVKVKISWWRDYWGECDSDTTWEWYNKKETK